MFYEDHEYATFPCCYAQTITPLDLFIYNYRIGDVQQSVSDTNQLKRIGHIETVLRRMISEYETLTCGDDGKAYAAMKAQGLLLSYLTTAMLVSKDKKQGRELAAKMMALFQEKLPQAYTLAVKQYKVFGMLNRLHVSKQTFEKLLRSRLYNKLRHKPRF